MAQKRMRLRSGSLTYLDVSSSKRFCKKKVPLGCRAVAKPMPADTDPQEDVTDADCVDDYGLEDDDAYMLFGSSIHEEDTRDDYMKRQAKASDNWSAIRDQLVHSVVETSCPVCPDVGPGVCIECQQAAVCVCTDCGPNAIYCLDHIEVYHAQVNIFHQPLIWKVRTKLSLLFIGSTTELLCHKAY